MYSLQFKSYRTTLNDLSLSRDSLIWYACWLDTRGKHPADQQDADHFDWDFAEVERKHVTDKPCWRRGMMSYSSTRQQQTRAVQLWLRYRHCRIMAISSAVILVCFNVMQLISACYLVSCWAVTLNVFAEALALHLPKPKRCELTFTTSQLPKLPICDCNDSFEWRFRAKKEREAFENFGYSCPWIYWQSPPTYKDWGQSNICSIFIGISSTLLESAWTGLWLLQKNGSFRGHLKDDWEQPMIFSVRSAC